MSMGPHPAGWYPDPQGSGAQRWWDGTAWTEHLHPPAAGAPAAGPGPGAPADDATRVGGGPVRLTKRGEQVSLGKTAGGGELTVHLAWQPGGVPGAPGIDLDLGCLWRLTDGTAGAVQALGGTFGQLHAPPWVALDGDDRSGAGGETLRVNLAAAAQIAQLVVYAYIYEGVPAWAQAGAVVTVHRPSGPPVEVPLTEGDPRLRLCAVAALWPAGGGFEVRRDVAYLADQRALDAAYAWGLPWGEDRK